jgi:hypothetical protein
VTKRISLGIIIKILTALAVIAGAAAGALFVLNPSDEFNRLFSGAGVYLYRAVDEPAISVFLGRLLVYIQPIIIIWFLAFIPAAAALSMFVLFALALGTAFSAALAFNAFGALEALRLLGPQIFLVLPAAAYIAAGSARQAAGSVRARMVALGGTPKIRLKGRETDYGTRLLAGLLAVVAAAFAEAWIL